MRFQLFNYTDGILFDPRLFESEDDALKAFDRWLKEREGTIYRTASGQRIDPAQLIVEVQEITGH